MKDERDYPVLPSAWTQTTLGEIAQVMDTDHKMPKAKEQGIFFISPKDFIGNGEIDFGKAKKISEEDFQRISRKCKPEIGDLIYSRIGTIGKIRKVPNSVKFHISYSLCIIRPHVQLKQNGFLFWLMQSPILLEQALSKRRSIGVPDLGLGDIKNFSIPLPPLTEQYRIIAKIEELSSYLDAGVEGLHKVKAQLKRYRQAVLKAAVEGRLTEEWRKAHPDVEPGEKLLERIRRTRDEIKTGKKITKNCLVKDQLNTLTGLPETWAWAKWEQVGISQNGRLFPSKEYQSNGFRLLRPGNLHSSGKVVWTNENTRYLPESWASDFPSFIVGPRELVMNLTAQSLKDEFLGRICITGQTECCLLNQRIARLTPIEVLPEYLLWMFKSQLFRKFVNGLNTGSLIQHMFTSQIADFCLPLPPLEEQSHIVSEIEMRFSVADNVEETLTQDLQRAESLRQSVLKRAFEGKLVPQDPNDEPASVLLDWIMAEKSGQVKRTRGSKINGNRERRLIND